MSDPVTASPGDTLLLDYNVSTQPHPLLPQPGKTTLAVTVLVRNPHTHQIACDEIVLRLPERDIRSSTQAQVSLHRVYQLRPHREKK